MNQETTFIESKICGEYASALHSLVENAQDSLRIMMFDWRWYVRDISSPASVLNQAFVRAARRGVSIRALVNYHAIVPQLAGVGIDARAFEQSKLLHAKCVIADDRVMLIGSHNLTESALSENIEISLLVQHTETIARLSAYFDSLWQS